MKYNFGYSDPSVAHDAQAGFVVGHRFLNQQTGIEWICLDSTVGAAKWRPASVSHVWPSQAYRTPEHIVSITDGQPAGGKLILHPLLVHQNVTVDKLGLVLVTGQSGAKARVGIYWGRYGQPNVLRADVGEIDLSGAAGLAVAPTGLALTPGEYFLAALFNAAPIQPTVKRVSGAVFGRVIGSGAELTGGNAGRYYVADLAYGTLPTTCPPVIVATGTDGAVVIARRS